VKGETIERTEIAWTPRQREVLDLLARGRTNPEIARDLGVSLDGAKWHVSEVMSILGVSSREAAAAYWRRENRLPARFARALRGLAFGPALRWTAAAVGAVAVVAVFVAVLLATRGGDESGKAIPEATETPAPSTPTPGQPTAASTATIPAPSPGPIGQINGEPVFELVPAPARELPAESVLYATISCAVCSGGELFRFFQGDTGEWVREKLSPDSMPGIDGGYPVGTFVSDGTGRFAALWCIPDPKGCGKTHDGMPDTRDRAVILSEDGGVSWRQVGRVPSHSGIAGFAGDQVAVNVASLGHEEATQILYPAGSPAPALITESGGVELPGGGLVTLDTVGVGGLANDNSIVLDVKQAPYPLLAFPGGTALPSIAVSGTLLAGWGERNSKAALNTTPPRELGGFPRSAILIDLEQRTVSPIAGVTGSDPNDIINPVAYSSGPIFRVAGAGDCLNLRAEPDTDAPVLNCFRDGVFLLDSGERRRADGQTWAAVTAPGKLLGWASVEYLELVGPL
jgi:DNA-binding CsgD family transcriptional regulator